MDKIIIKYRGYIIGSIITIIGINSYYNELNNFLNWIFSPILIGVMLLIFTEKRQRDIYFKDELAKIHKYFDIDYYLNNNYNCFNGCEVYYNIKDFIEKFKCESYLSNKNKHIYDSISKFYNIYGDSIKIHINSRGSSIYKFNYSDLTSITLQLEREISSSSNKKERDIIFNKFRQEIQSSEIHTELLICVDSIDNFKEVLYNVKELL
jgi:hypothetical protein